MKKKFFIPLFIILILFTSCTKTNTTKIAERPNFENEELQFSQIVSGSPIAIFNTNLGTIKAALFPEQAPLATENFIYLAENGYYNGLEFYRVVSDFVVQSGSPNNNGDDGDTKWNNPFPSEFSDLLHHYSGALSMSNRDNENEKVTNTSIFYFTCTQADSVDKTLVEKMTEAGVRQEVIDTYKEVGGIPYLDNTNTVFGQIYEGMDILDTIAIQEVNEDNVPIIPIIIDSIVIGVY